MLQRATTLVLLATLMLACGIQNQCQVKDSQIWRGVFQRECSCNKAGSTDMLGPFCAVDATVKVSGDSTSLSITDVSYRSCGVVNTTSCYWNPMSGETSCHNTIALQNISQLRCGSKQADGVCFITTNASNCDTGDLTYYRPRISFEKLSGHIGNGLLTVWDSSYDSDDFGCTTCRSTWKFFAPPALPADGVVIQSRETGLCLTLFGGKTTNGNALSLSDCSKSHTNQKWKFVDGQLIYAGVDNPIDVKFVGSPTPKCVDLFGGNVGNGQQLEIWDCAQTAQQQWSYDSSLGTVYLASQLGRETLKCMDLRNGQFVVQVWDCIYGAWNQQWIVHSSEQQAKPSTTTQFLV